MMVDGSQVNPAGGRRLCSRTPIRQHHGPTSKAKMQAAYAAAVPKGKAVDRTALDRATGVAKETAVAGRRRHSPQDCSSEDQGNAIADARALES